MTHTNSRHRSRPHARVCSAALVTLCIGVPAQESTGDRAATVHQLVLDYRTRAKAYTEAAAGLASRDSSATPADWKPILGLRAPMDAARQALWSEFLAGPRDGLGLEICLFLGTQTNFDVAVLRGEVIAHYADEDAVSALATFRTAPQQFGRADETFLRELISSSRSPSVRAAATATLARGLHEMAVFLGDLATLGSSIEDSVVDSMERATNVMRETFGVASDRPAPDREKLRESVRRSRASISLFGWEGADPGSLADDAEQLLGSLRQLPAETPILAVRFDADRATTTVAATAERLATELDALLHDGIVGRPAPELVAVDYAGRQVSLADLRGKVVLLDFWATWCAPCRAAMPGNDAIAARLRDRPFALVTLSVDRDPETARRFMESHDYRFTNWFVGPEHPALAAFRVDSYPTWVVVDDLGIVQSVPRADHAALERLLERLVEHAESRGDGRAPSRH